MQAYVDLYWLAGPLEGKTTNHISEHANWDTACEWAANATMNPDVKFVVLEMENTETGELERF